MIYILTRGLGPERSCNHFVLFQVVQNRRSRYILPPWSMMMMNSHLWPRNGPTSCIGTGKISDHWKSSAFYLSGNLIKLRIWSTWECPTFYLFIFLRIWSSWKFPTSYLFIFLRIWSSWEFPTFYLSKNLIKPRMPYFLFFYLSENLIKLRIS